QGRTAAPHGRIRRLPGRSVAHRTTGRGARALLDVGAGRPGRRKPRRYPDRADLPRARRGEAPPPGRRRHQPAGADRTRTADRPPSRPHHRHLRRRGLRAGQDGGAAQPHLCDPVRGAPRPVRPRRARRGEDRAAPGDTNATTAPRVSPTASSSNTPNPGTGTTVNTDADRYLARAALAPAYTRYAPEIAVPSGPVVIVGYHAAFAFHPAAGTALAAFPGIDLAGMTASSFPLMGLVRIEHAT